MTESKTTHKVIKYVRISFKKAKEKDKLKARLISKNRQQFKPLKFILSHKWLNICHHRRNKF